MFVHGCRGVCGGVFSDGAILWASLINENHVYKLDGANFKTTTIMPQERYTDAESGHPIHAVERIVQCISTTSCLISVASSIFPCSSVISAISCLSCPLLSPGEVVDAGLEQGLTRHAGRIPSAMDAAATCTTGDGRSIDEREREHDIHLIMMPSSVPMAAATGAVCWHLTLGRFCGTLLR